MRLGRFSRPRVRFQCSATQPRQAAPRAGSKPQPTEWRQESGARRRAARDRGKGGRVYVCTAAPGALVRAGSGPGRQRPGGRGEGSESWPELPHTQCRQARKGMRADRVCPSLCSWEPDTETSRRYPVPVFTFCTPDTCPERQPGPLLILPQKHGAGSGRWFLQASVGAGDTEWDPLLSPVPSSAAHPSAALCLQPSASLGRSMGKATHLEGPEESQGKESSRCSPTLEA